MNLPFRFVFSALALSASTLPVAAQTPTPSSLPIVWMGAPGHAKGKAMRDLFERPDDWKETRSLVDVLFFADHAARRDFTDDELTRWFAQARAWNLKIAMEVGAIKPWGRTGADTFAKEKANWERLQKLGANLYAIAMDEPLACTRNELHETDDYAADQTAEYVALVRQSFPNLLVGDIEAYPFTSVEDHERWIEALNKRLAAKAVRGLDFYRVDVDWMHFIVGNKGSWRDLTGLEHWCRQHKLPFQLIYWAADFGSLTRRGLADDSTWYTGIMQQGYDYASVGGKPDGFIIQSWIGAPSQCLPETGEWTFTRSARDFVKKFLKREKTP